MKGELMIMGGAAPGAESPLAEGRVVPGRAKKLGALVPGAQAKGKDGGTGKGKGARSPFEEQLGLIADPSVVNAQNPMAMQARAQVLAKATAASAAMRGNSVGAASAAMAQAVRLADAVNGGGTNGTHGALAGKNPSSDRAAVESLPPRPSTGTAPVPSSRTGRPSERREVREEESARDDHDRATGREAVIREAETPTERRPPTVTQPSIPEARMGPVEGTRELPQVHAPLPVLPPELTEGPVWAVLMPRSAHLSIEADGARLSLRLRLNDATADLSVSGVQASAVVAHENELRVALAAEGLSLGQLATGDRERDPSREREEAPAPVVPSGAAQKKRLHAAASQAEREVGPEGGPRLHATGNGRLHVEA